MAAVVSASSCTATSPGPGEAQIWTSRTVWDERGTPTTEHSYRTEQIVEPVKGREWAYQGVWSLQEYFPDTDKMGSLECLVRLDPAKVSDSGHMLTLAPDCPGILRHLASWYPSGQEIVFLDRSGSVTGRVS